MALTIRLRVPLRPAASLLLGLTLACGDDGGDTGGDVGPASTGSATTTTGASSSGGGESTGAASSDGPATSESSGGDSTGGMPTDPNYPPPDGGICPGGTTPVTLPNAELCAPSCTGADDRSCPAAASGDAPPVCFPFFGMGGSGDPCDAMTPCPAGEACSDGTCSEVAFWACQLECGTGEACPDGMSCTAFGTCGY